MWKIKDPSVLNLDTRLQEIAVYVYDTFMLDTVTSAHRPGDSGVHGTMPSRGVDLRCHDYGLGKFIEDRVNSLWQYDKERPDMKPAMYHESEPGAGDWHLHLQSHPNTRRKGLEKTNGRYPV